MAQLAVGVGGAVLGGIAGYFTGGLADVLVGAGLGFSIGGMVGAELFPVKGPTVYGSRIGDLTITASTYGVVRPVVFGNAQVAGNVIWGTPIQEISTTTEVGGGGGGKGAGSKGGGGNEVNYTYTATFALALCQGPIDQVVRIWMNGAIVYDISSGTSEALGTDTSDPIATAVDSINAGNSANSPINFRFYPGSSTQLPDSLIEAAEGVGNVPGYRGLCYLVFDSLLLTNFGDRIPNIQVEVTTSSVESNSFQELSRGEFAPTYQMVLDSALGADVAVREAQAGYFGFLPGPDHPTEENVLETNISLTTGAGISVTFTNGTVPDLFTSYASAALAINPLTLTGYVWGESPTGIVEFDLQTMEVTAEFSLDYIIGSYNTWDSVDITGTTPLFVGFDQNLYGLLDNDVMRVNPSTMTNGTMISLGSDDNIGSPFAPNIATLAAPLGLVGPNGTQNFTVVAGGNMFHVRIVELGYTFSATGNSFSGMCPGEYGSMSGTAFITGLTSTFLGAGGGADLFIDQITASVSVSVGLTGVDYSTGFNYENVFLLDPATINPAATGWEFVSGPCFDPTDNSIVFSGQVSIGLDTGPSYFMKWSATGGLIYATEYPNSLAAVGSGASSDLREGSFAVFTGETALQFDLASGAVTGIFPWVLTASGAQVYSGAFNSILLAGSGPLVWEKIAVGQLSSVPPSLATVVSGVCTLADMDSSLYDVTQIAEIPIDGFVMSQRTTAINVLTPLMQLYQIDVVETDYKLVFQPRGGDIVATIAQDVMVRPESGNHDNSQSEPYTEMRIQEMDMPMRYTVTYVDETVQYQPNTQSAKRTVFPNRSMYSDQQIDLQVGLVMTPEAAAQQAEILLYATWLARHTFKCTLPPDFWYLNTADPITLTLDSGYSARFRIGAFDTGINGATECTLYGETDGQHVSTAPGQGGNIPPNVVPYFVQTKFFLLDTPLLRDIDDTAGTAIRAYWAAAPYASGTWAAAQLQGSADDDMWNTLDIESNTCAWGTIDDALPNAVGCMHVRESDFIIVSMEQGGASLASCTYTQLANGANAAAVFKTNGDVEIIGFLNVTALANNNYMLMGLARGQRGTDTMADGHGASELIVFLSTTTVDPITLPLAIRGASGFYRAVTAGTLPSSAPVTTQTFQGRDQMPYAPVQVAATFSGSDVVLTWNRRNRLTGNLVASVADYLLNEQAESYSIDIYDALAETVVRTLTATSPTVTYTAAEITADFGGAITTLNVSVYQLSATVGRGFARLDSLEIAA